MHIGIDFDNTIVNYDRVFFRHALKLGLISKGVKRNKQIIRDAIRILPEGNDKWTKLQGLVYGKYMDEAELTQGVKGFLKACKKNSFKVSIISHKTLYPAIGPRINLHVAAEKWLKNMDFLSNLGLAKSDVMFKETLEEKLDAISQRQCEYFIDDLKEVLSHPSFPKGVKKILYGQQENTSFLVGIKHFRNWNEITKHFFG